MTVVMQAWSKLPADTYSASKFEVQHLEVKTTQVQA